MKASIEQDSICGVCHSAHVPYVAVLPGSAQTVCRPCLSALAKAVDAAEVGDSAKARGPELLAALEALAGAVDGHTRRCGSGDSELYDASDEALALIKKTRGVA